MLVGDLLAERGATTEEIDAHAQEADRVRARLAELIGGPDADVDARGEGAAA
jgi:hypothetical protein